MGETDSKKMRLLSTDGYFKEQQRNSGDVLWVPFINLKEPRMKRSYLEE